MAIMKTARITALGLVFLCGGCATIREVSIQQETVGPHGGALFWIDCEIPEYVEFVAIPGEKEWTFQMFMFDANMKPQSIYGSAHLTIELSDGTKKSVALWNTKPYFWSKGMEHLENNMSLKNVSEFAVKLVIRHGQDTDRLTFKYPYN